MKRTSKTALAMAAAAAALFATGCSTLCGEPCEPMVKCCLGDACKGSADRCGKMAGCKGHHHAHSHGGKNWSYMSRSECLAQGGSVVE